MQMSILLSAAVGIGFLHTLLGPDHYLPFIALARAQDWSSRKTLAIVALCGLGHVGSSIVLGLLGIGLGEALAKLVHIEALRGEWAAWLVIAFGLAYSLWALRRLYSPGLERHSHRSPFLSPRASHQHNAHSHQLATKNEKSAGLTFWALFIIFIFGPCEPLIPLLIYPAAVFGLFEVALVVAVFSLVTVGTMLALVVLAGWGLRLIPSRGWERYSHLAAGAAILFSGLGIQFLNW